MRTFLFSIFISLMVFSLQSKSDLTKPLIWEADNSKTVIAVTPFSYTSNAVLKEGVGKIISADLYRSGHFKTIAASDLLIFPEHNEEVVFSDWRMQGIEYLSTANLQPNATGFTAHFTLYNIISKSVILELTTEVGTDELRDLAHYISDKTYEAITGIPGAFSSQIMYIEQSSSATFHLVIADMDGDRPRHLLSSSKPLMSPVWSPDAKSVSYVTTEAGRPTIYILQIATGQRQKIIDFSGLIGFPSWSPDGKKLALVLLEDGSPEIYTLDIATKKLTRVTNHPALDEDPIWSGDGKAIVFTSNRDGNPQIYRVTLTSGRIERLTLEGNYNAKPQLTPDGKVLVMIHRYRNNFYLAFQEIEMAEVRLLNQISLKESPSIAPNGYFLLYGKKDGNRKVLAGVSLDGLGEYTFPVISSDALYPTWSPALRFFFE